MCELGTPREIIACRVLAEIAKDYQFGGGEKGLREALNLVVEAGNSGVDLTRNKQEWRAINTNRQGIGEQIVCPKIER